MSNIDGRAMQSCPSLLSQVCTLKKQNGFLPWVLESRHVDDSDGRVRVVGGGDGPVDQVDDGVEGLLVKASHEPFQGVHPAAAGSIRRLASVVRYKG